MCAAGCQTAACFVYDSQLSLLVKDRLCWLFDQRESLLRWKSQRIKKTMGYATDFLQIFKAIGCGFLETFGCRIFFQRFLKSIGRFGFSYGCFHFPVSGVRSARPDPKDLPYKRNLSTFSDLCPTVEDIDALTKGLAERLVNCLFLQNFQSSTFCIPFISRMKRISI